MSHSTKHLTWRIVVHALVLAVFYVLQTTVFSRLRIFNVTPLIMPMLVIGVGLFEGPTWGGGFGLAAGVLSDMAFSDTTIFFTVILTALGMGMGLASQYLFSRGFPSYILTSAVALVLIALLQLFPLLVFFGQSPLALLRVAGLQTMYSLLFALPIYWLARRLGRHS